MPGPWLGQWPGEWLGDWEGARQPPAPGNLYANIGGGGSISANLSIAEAEVIEFPSGGAFQPRRLKDPRKKREDEELLLFFN